MSSRPAPAHPVLTSTQPTSAPSPASPIHPPASPSPTPAPLPTVRAGSHQILLAAHGAADRDEANGGSLDFPPLAGHLPLSGAGAVVRPQAGLRQPSYGQLGGADEGAGGVLRRRETEGAGSLTGGEERLAKRPRLRERRDADSWEVGRSREKRQYPYAEGYPSCSNVGNDVLSCYPETNTTLVQGEYSNTVDVYLYNANTDDLAASWLNRTNANGMISILPEDLWWASPRQSTDEWFGDAAQNRTTPYYFVVVDGGTELDGGEEHQATFDVVQTAAPTSLSSSLAVLTASSLSSASSASSVSSLASRSSYIASLSSAGLLTGSLASSLLSGQTSLPSGSSSSSGGSGRGRNGGDLQNSSSGGTSIPKWAIALIVIFGFLALVGGALAVFFCLGRARKRRAADEAAASRRDAGYASEDDVTNGSRDPILGAGGRGSTAGSTSHGGAGTALLAAGVGAGAGAFAGAAGKEEKRDAEGNTISHTDAARMAEAFRAALRRPDFPEGEGSPNDSPGEVGGEERPGLSPTGGPQDSHGSGEEAAKGRALAEEELRSEGRSVRNVEGGKRWGPTA
ncbi:hypothetical protein JCM10213v2_008902 [Rhodosporidiobolus nylandii]